MPLQKYIFCGADFGSTIALDLQQKSKPFLHSSICFSSELSARYCRTPGKSSFVILILRSKQYYRVVTALIKVQTFAYLVVSQCIVKLCLCADSQILRVVIGRSRAGPQKRGP